MQTAIRFRYLLYAAFVAAGVIAAGHVTLDVAIEQNPHLSRGEIIRWLPESFAEVVRSPWSSCSSSS